MVEVQFLSNWKMAFLKNIEKINKVWDFPVIKKVIDFLKKIQVDTENSTVAKVWIFLYSLFMSLITAGTIFGWSALLVAMIDQGVYAQYCYPLVEDPTK